MGIVPLDEDRPDLTEDTPQSANEVASYNVSNNWNLTGNLRPQLKNYLNEVTLRGVVTLTWVNSQ